MIDIDNETSEIKVHLTDFGLSRVLPKGAFIKGKSGTLVVQAPEIILG